MARPAKPSTTLLAQVRQHFDLDQQQLATYLGIGPAMVGHLEAGRRTLSSAVLLRLAPLAAHLPAAPAPPEDPTAHLAPPAAGPLAARLDQCRHEAGKLRRELRRLGQQVAHARRWQQALPTLLAAADERTRPWLLRRQEQAAADLGGPEAARYHLLRLRAEALEAEAAGLAALLGEGSSASK